MLRRQSVFGKNRIWAVFLRLQRAKIRLARDPGDRLQSRNVLLALPVSLFLKIQIIFAKCVSCMEKKIK